MNYLFIISNTFFYYQKHKFNQFDHIISGKASFLYQICLDKPTLKKSPANIDHIQHPEDTSGRAKNNEMLEQIGTVFDLSVSKNFLKSEA